MSNSTVAATVPRRKRSVARARVILFSMVGAILLVIAGMVGPIVLDSYDSSHREELTCRVDSVDALSGRSSSRTGIGGASALVRVQTDSCGVLDIRDGVTPENVDGIAAELTEGETYVFSVGAGSLQIEGLLGFFKQEPPIYDFRPVS